MHIKTLALFFALSLLVSCRAGTVIIWTSESEFVPYIEMFNASHNDVKVVVNYKENPAAILPAAKDETPPDIIIGTSLRTDNAIKYFRSVNYLFSSRKIDKTAFYTQLLDACKKNKAMSLIPVSFNIPAVVFSTVNAPLMADNYMLSLDQIQDAAASYNKKSGSGLYTKMGFAPQWNADFLCLVAMMYGADFHETKDTLLWDKDALENAIEHLKAWTASANSSFADEQDFLFKYLYMPAYNQVLSGQCLFAYLTSDKLFSLSQGQLENLEFRWIHSEGKIPVSNPMVTMGMYKHGKNKRGAEQFISWFFTEEAQKTSFDHIRAMHLDTATFGIAGGFSSLKNVNEHLFPVYYHSLIANIPPENSITPLPVLPMRWENIKETVIIPYLQDAIRTDIKNTPKAKTLEERAAEWSKQYF